MKYIKKPVSIEAIQFMLLDSVPCKFGAMKEHNGMEVFKFMGLTSLIANFDSKGAYITIKTLEGDHRADIGDYIIKGIKGEFYPCKPDIFKMTYYTQEEYANL